MSAELAAVTCALCGSHINEAIEIPFAFFRHMDFEIVKRGGRILQCPSCQMISNCLTDGEITSNETLFRDKDYLQSQLIEHVVYNSATDSLESRSSLQAKIIKRMLPYSKLSILDIGCFKGDLLRDIGRCYGAADLHGFDINEEFRTWFPVGQEVHFWSGDLSDINRKFNLIILSASIMYIKDIAHLMNQIRRLLLPDGVIFIHAVDVSQNPYAILLGDQFYHYTPTIMRNLLLFHGFNFEVLECGWFPKEFLGFARNDPNASSRSLERDDSVSWCIKMINEKAKKIRMLAEKYPDFGILGTTSAAAFVDSIAQSNVRFFADENPKRVGLRFHGKDVLHPSLLHDEDVMLIPYGDSGIKIKERFCQKYKGQFVCL